MYKYFRGREFGQGERAYPAHESKGEIENRFAEFLKAALPKKQAWLIRRLGDYHVAEEILQIASVKLWESYKEKNESELWPLFSTIVANALHDYYREKKRLRFIIQAGDLEPEDFEGDTLEIFPSDPGESPEGLLSRKQSEGILLRLIDLLTPQQKMVLFYRIIKGYSTLEVAKMMNISEGTVKTHLGRGLENLRQAITQYTTQVKKPKKTPRGNKEVEVSHDNNLQSASNKKAPALIESVQHGYRALLEAFPVLGISEDTSWEKYFEIADNYNQQNRFQVIPTTKNGVARLLGIDDRRFCPHHIGGYLDRDNDRGTTPPQSS